MSGMRIHLVGIGGAGLSAIARLLKEQGYEVSGSDKAFSPLMEELTREGIRVFTGHKGENVHGASLVLISSAVPVDNPEVQEAIKQGIPVLKRRDFLGWLTQNHKVIAVAGTHGKSTTTAMIAHILDKAGLSPSFIVGGLFVDSGLNARHGQGQYFVIEADEYDRTFLGLKPFLAIVTAVEMDHPDCYPDLDSMKEAYAEFLSQVKPEGYIVGCGDEENVVELMVRAKRPFITYGLKKGNTWQAEPLNQSEAGGRCYLVRMGERTWGPFTLAIPGLQNVKNALGAIASCHCLGVDPEIAGVALSSFRGLKRRFEVKGEVKGVTVVDDYAHHPTEIRATLAAARERFPGREIWAVFQPHTYSRTKALLEEFAASFSQADHVILCDIYAAREKDDLGISSLDILALMDHPDARYIGSLEAATFYLREHLKPGSVLITLGAGDVYKVGEEILEWLRGRFEKEKYGN